MTNHISKAAAGAVALIGLLVSACSADKEDVPAVVPDGPEMSVSLKGLAATANVGATSVAVQPALNVYQFGEGKLFRKSVIDKYDASAISHIKGSTTGLYCVSGIDIATDASTTESDFILSTVTSEDGAASAPLFLSAAAAIEPTQMSCELTMKRGVARIDLDARDADMEITHITVDDAPAATYVFAGEAGKLDAATTVYRHDYATPPTGIEKSVFMLFESTGEVHVNVHGTANGAEISVPAVIPAVERNKVYTLRVYDKFATVKAEFIVADWEDGGVYDSSLDTSGRLVIDRANSVFPAGVTVDYDNNFIEVPPAGVSGMKIAFSTELRVDVDSVYYSGARVEADSVKEKYVRIAVGKAVNTPTGVVSTVTVDIDEQLKGRPDYEIKMELRKTNMTMSYDNVTIHVAESPYQIQTVKIAGLEWMAFNATTTDLSDQIYTPLGTTVEETYQTDWANAIGNFFQYGRQKHYSPWTKNDPNGNEATQRNIPWNAPECMPLPEGYRVTTQQDWLSLLPAGTTIPSTYTAANGEEIKAELITLPGTLDDSPSAAANKAKLLKRYLRFESMETHNVLIIPVCALKTASWDEYPGGGRAMHAWASYWIAEDRYIWLFQISGSNDNLVVSQAINRWNYNGFMPVRGIKQN